MIQQEKDIRKFFTHDNGGRPFKVQINEKTKKAKVYKFVHRNNQDCSDQNYEEIVFETSFQKYFTGGPLSNSFYQNKYSFQDGNSVLLHVTGQKYVFIGILICNFDSFQEIVQFVSPIGNNDVPYTYARTENQIILFGDDVVLNNKVIKELEQKFPHKAYSPYNFYYQSNHDQQKAFVLRKFQYSTIQQRLW